MDILEQGKKLFNDSKNAVMVRMIAEILANIEYHQDEIKKLNQKIEDVEKNLALADVTYEIRKA